MDSYQQKTTDKPILKTSLSEENNVSDSVSKNNTKKTIKKYNPKFIFGIFSLVLLIAGGLIGLYLTSINQDLRQQASVGGDPIDPYKNKECGPGLHQINGEGECVSEDLKCKRGSCGSGETCHCQDGQPCLETECEDDYLIENCEDNQGRSYWKNSGADAYTCCAAGFTCCPSGNGCCGEPNPTNPPGEDPTPTPTTTTTPTPTPTLPPEITPTLTPTPTPTTPVGPQCHDITMFNITNGQTAVMSGDDDLDLVPDESTVRFTCSNDQGNDLPTGYFYAFRIYEPCQSPNHFDPLEFLNDEGENGVNYPVVYSGDYQAQCAVCSVDTEGDTVCDWEAIAVTECYENIN